MENLPKDLIGRLFARDNNAAYAALSELLRQSDESDGVYNYMDLFGEMMRNDDTYVRIRGMRLFAANAKWDAEKKAERYLGSFLQHICDEKPIAARQCVQALPLVAASKPHLKEQIAAALASADTSRYSESMRPLVERDIRKALLELQK